MTTRDQAHNGLTVYGTDGEEFYPDSVDGTEHPEVREWFLSTGLRCYLDRRQSRVMVYLGNVRHSSGLDQAFAVYEGSRGESLLTGLKQAVSEGLVEGRGWEISRATSPSEQKSLFTFLSKNDLQTRRLPPYIEYDSELLQRALTVDNTAHAVEPLEFIVRDYQIAAELMKAYSDIEQIRIHVYDNQDIQPPEGADLVIKVEPGPYEVKVPTETATLLQSLQHRLESHKAQERKEATIKAIEAHAEQGDDLRVVRDAVEKGFEKYYPTVDVIPQEERERLETQLEQKQQELQQANSDINSLQSDYERERRRRRRLEKKARLKEAIANLAGSIGVSHVNEQKSAKADVSTELDFTIENDSATYRSWKVVIPIVLVGLLGIGIAAVFALCKVAGINLIPDGVSSFLRIRNLNCFLILFPVGNIGSRQFLLNLLL